MSDNNPNLYSTQHIDHETRARLMQAERERMRLEVAAKAAQLNTDQPTPSIGPRAPRPLLSLGFHLLSQQYATKRLDHHHPRPRTAQNAAPMSYSYPLLPDDVGPPRKKHKSSLSYIVSHFDEPANTIQELAPPNLNSMPDAQHDSANSSLENDVSRGADQATTDETLKDILGVDPKDIGEDNIDVTSDGRAPEEFDMNGWMNVDGDDVRISDDFGLIRLDITESKPRNCSEQGKRSLTAKHY